MSAHILARSLDHLDLPSDRFSDIKHPMNIKTTFNCILTFYFHVRHGKHYTVDCKASIFNTPSPCLGVFGAPYCPSQREKAGNYRDPIVEIKIISAF